MPSLDALRLRFLLSKHLALSNRHAQGRRKSLEDRTLCVLDLRIPFPGKAGVKEVTVGIVAVFDGHNGAEAVRWLRSFY
ncbi:uncharacterized protein Pyn_33112 [Prunus yedoensis var. nudiflora]|uniref:PPM-type phosphatase domain-containing protein n=1 Tax=Prunus yedoensis var. nudiflora TaxID=2094558 RepID=A0A314UT20_PRUYE|nr:uncharacterized protein Pyn_33112 [Prunus yedoensis var. nudiflora]